MEIHIWDLLRMNDIKIAVDIKNSLKKRIAYTIKSDMYNLSKELNIKPSRLYEYFIWEKSLIPLDILFNISNKIDISRKEIEKNIISYKQIHVPEKISVKNPEFPIKISPYFTSIIANLFFDGSVPKDGKGTYYNQKNEKIMNDFIKKIKSVFGEVNYSLRKDHKEVLSCRLPRLIGEICREVYQVKSFGTFDSEIPKIMFTFNKEHKMAFVITALIDEGSITYDGQIAFGVCNKMLAEGVKTLCNKVGLKTTNTNQTSKSNYYYFYIKSKERLLQIINLMNKEYPLISLDYKKERLEHYFEIKKYPGLRNKKGGDSRKKRILKSLKDYSKSINQLSKELIILPRSLRRHLATLTKECQIKKNKIGNEYVYSLG